MLQLEHRFKRLLRPKLGSVTHMRPVVGGEYGDRCQFDCWTDIHSFSAADIRRNLQLWCPKCPSEKTGAVQLPAFTVIALLVQEITWIWEQNKKISLFFLPFFFMCVQSSIWLHRCQSAAEWVSEWSALSPSRLLGWREDGWRAWMEQMKGSEYAFTSTQLNSSAGKKRC